MSDLAERLSYQIQVNAIVKKGTRQGFGPVFTPEELDEMEDWYYQGKSPAEFAAMIEARDTDIIVDSL